MQQRVAEDDLPGGPADRELTEMKQRQIVEGASKVLFEKGFARPPSATSPRPAACRWGSSTTTSRPRTTSSILMHLLQPGAVVPAPGRGGASSRYQRPGGQAGAWAADHHPLPLRESGPLPVHLHREQVPGQGASAEGAGAGRPERGRLLPAPAVARSRDSRRGPKPTSPPT